MPWQFLADNLPHVTAALNATATVLLVLGLTVSRVVETTKFLVI